MEKTVRPFGIKDKLGYLMGDLANDFTFMFASTYVLVFYTKVMGVASEIVGLMFLLARILDAFTDIGMGRIADSAKPTKNGKFRPWILRMMGPVAVAAFLMYQSALQNAPMGVKIAYMFITYILWGSVFYTSINIPYGSMASVISDKPEERSSLSVFRSLGGMFAAVFIMVLAPLIVYTKDEAGNTVVVPKNFTLTAAVLSVLAILCYMLCYFWTAERVQVPEKKEKASVMKTLSLVFRNRALIGILLSALLMLLASLLSQGMYNFLFADYFNSASALSAFSALAMPAGIILALTSTKLSLKFGKREVGFVGCFFSGILYVIIGLLKIKNVWLYILLSFITMLGYYFFTLQCYALVTDVIDDIEVQTGNRDDGTVYGVYSFSRKLGQAIAGGMSGWALSAIGYNELATVQTEAVKNGIYAIVNIVPGIIYILCGLTLLLIYPLTKERVLSNVEELKRRHNRQD